MRGESLSVKNVCVSDKLLVQAVSYVVQLGDCVMGVALN